MHVSSPLWCKQVPKVSARHIKKLCFRISKFFQPLNYLYVDLYRRQEIQNIFDKKVMQFLSTVVTYLLKKCDIGSAYEVLMK